MRAKVKMKPDSVRSKSNFGILLTGVVYLYGAAPVMKATAADANNTKSPQIEINWCLEGPAPPNLLFQHAWVAGQSHLWFCFDGIAGRKYNTWCGVEEDQYCRPDGTTACGTILHFGVGATKIEGTRGCVDMQNRDRSVSRPVRFWSTPVN